MNIPKLEIGVLVQNLLKCHPLGEQLKHVAHPNSHASHTWTPTTLAWVHSDSIKDLGHTFTLAAILYHSRPRQHNV